MPPTPTSKPYKKGKMPSHCHTAAATLTTPSMMPPLQRMPPWFVLKPIQAAAPLTTCAHDDHDSAAYVHERETLSHAIK
ncbi:hypothetical protein BJY52DRAFT_1189480 [Lactarius psammicola]|nr:hypothetical protein BJY52DRAFT_1189480 [Lactarius psammicola]